MLCGQCFSEIAGADVCPVCGFDNAEQRTKYPVALRPGAILNGQYVVGRVLGQGGFGITYLAMDDRTKTRVAIKEYYPAEFAGRGIDGTSVQILSGNRTENFTYGKEQFLSEARTLAEVRGNAHIVQIFSYFEENGTAYFVMEYVEGKALNTLLQERGKFAPKAADALLLPLMEALAWVHEKGIVHRDIAPDNIIVTKDGTAKLIDFGAARYSTGEKSKSLDVILKHGFAPKEQYTRRGRQGPWTDVYALAATYYYAITGKVPPDAIDRMEQDDLVAPTTLGVKMEPEAEEALLKGLELNAQDRWQSMADFAAAMRAPSLRAAEEAERERLERERREKEAAEKAERDRLAREAKEEKARQRQAAKAQAERKKAEQKARSKQQKEPVKTAEAEGTRKRSPLALILAAAAVLVLVIVGVVALGGKKTASPAVTQPTAATVPASAGQTAEAILTASPAPAAVPAAFKLGSQGPLTGGAAIYGQSVMNGIMLAVDEINAMDDGFHFEFMAQDDQADAGGKAVNAYNALMEWGMQVMAGTVTSGSGITVSAQAFQDRVFMLTPSASATDLTAGKDNAFQVCFTEPNQGAASADYIAEHFAGTKVAVIYRNDDAYSQSIHDTFMAEAAAKGVEVVFEGGFVDGVADFSVYLIAAKNAGADMVFLPIYYQPAAIIFTQAAVMGYKPTFFGVDGMDGILGQENFDTALAEGVFLLTPFAADADDARTQAFVAEYQKRYGEIPNQFAADGYDAVYILKAALEAAGCTPDMSAADICETLIQVMPNITVDGVTGQGMTWSSNGEVSKAPMAVVIKDGAYVTPAF